MKICETFVSIQGEGLMMGAPTLFIRTSGCNLDCSWCDTKYAFGDGRETDVAQLVEMAAGISHVCVTGGEPMLQEELPELLEALISEGKHVVLETNGSMDVSRLPKDRNLMISMDIKCPSSGMSERMLASNIAVLGEKDQLKFIIGDDSDFEFATDVLRTYMPGTNVIFSPVGGMDLRPLAEEVLRRKLEVRVLPQLHKIIWGDRRSV
ncbi:MAG: radical SAM protein [Candidatus Methanomethylophilaceae archaeon]|jgi:7-carboxy-7-deazaguanine synthase|nr:radical SAM protein [Candidatus Methanomethylophilaceae archaeon]NCA73365.1 radical SAM protein [Gammaproteobacteria bacterium]MDD2935867.1 radical SAM protein [Candidatus Methanomethylophilaceae archaeon]MDD3351016.1 radical SAM protein [Candidatus Methanomethylophilaceae archaeon]MDD3986382.1 radical SAM protein [Candidatus Methanomethylophilaceae archaeon]